MRDGLSAHVFCLSLPSSAPGRRWLTSGPSSCNSLFIRGDYRSFFYAETMLITITRRYHRIIALSVIAHIRAEVSSVPQPMTPESDPQCQPNEGPILPLRGTKFLAHSAFLALRARASSFGRFRNGLVPVIRRELANCPVWMAPALQAFFVVAVVCQYSRASHCRQGMQACPRWACLRGDCHWPSLSGHCRAMRCRAVDEFREQGSYRLNDL